MRFMRLASTSPTLRIRPAADSWCKDASFDLETAGKLSGMAFLELYEGENRLVVDHGASGAPVVDCEGRVAAVVSNVFTLSFQWAYRLGQVRQRQTSLASSVPCPISDFGQTHRYATAGDILPVMQVSRYWRLHSSAQRGAGNGLEARAGRAASVPDLRPAIHCA